MFGLLVWMVSLAGLRAGAIEDLIAKPPVIENPPWAGCDPPEVEIPKELRRMEEGPEPVDRAVAIGSLVLIARELAEFPQTKAAAAELLDRHIIPNLDLAKAADETAFCSWRRTVIGCKNAYQKLGDRGRVDALLTLLEKESPRQDDREMVLYLRAYQHAEDKNYALAIETINRLPEESHWTAQRPVLVQRWQRQKDQMEHQQKQRQARERLEAARRAKQQANHAAPARTQAAKSQSTANPKP